MGRQAIDRAGRIGSVECLYATDSRDAKGQVLWQCKCDCGTEWLVSSPNVPKTHSCGCLGKSLPVGSKCGILTITRVVRSKCYCDCDCGNAIGPLDSSDLRSGNIKSCGCLKLVAAKRNIFGQRHEKVICTHDGPVGDCKPCRRNRRRANVDHYRITHGNHQAKRRALEHGVTVATITSHDWRSVLLKNGGLCVYCGAEKATQRDHIVPLTRGGAHMADNLAPSCRTCNLSKGNRLLHSEWVPPINRSN